MVAMFTGGPFHNHLVVAERGSFGPSKSPIEPRSKPRENGDCKRFDGIIGVLRSGDSVKLENCGSFPGNRERSNNRAAKFRPSCAAGVEAESFSKGAHVRRKHLKVAKNSLQQDR